MRFTRDLRQLLHGQRFRQLFTVRVTSQGSDGVFQVALASYVLFSPERQPDATAIAAALAAVLLPFSVLGPFVGVFLDRWSRRQILAFANLLRIIPVLAVAAAIAATRDSAGLFALILLALSINRFLLSGLSAALPHVVDRDELVLANSVTPTSGTIAFMIGLGLASAVRTVVPMEQPDVVIVAASAVGYAAAGLLALRLPRPLLGPDHDPSRPQVRDALGNVAHGLVEGLRHLRHRPVPAYGLSVVAAHRFFYGLSTVTTILLYRNYFYAPDQTDQALAGLASAVLVSGVGYFGAAVLTPMVTAHMTKQAWMVTLLAAAAVFEAFPGGLFTQPALLVAAFALGVSAQGVKICVDTLVQTGVDDAFRGRVFALYDVIFNVVFVAAAAVGALIIPTSGKSYLVLAIIAVGYAVTGVVYARAAHSRPEPRTPVPSRHHPAGP
ncbi:MAG: MFS transporter [Nocardioidaceae bacterium]